MAEVFITLDNIQDYNPKKHYTVVADYEIYGKIEPCLVFAVGTVENYTRLMTNPNENDLRSLQDGKNPRLHEVKPENCWWNYGTD